MVGMPGFWARFLALDQTAGGGGAGGNPVLQVYWDRTYSFAGLMGQKRQFHISTGTGKVSFYSSLGSEKRREKPCTKNPVY